MRIAFVIEKSPRIARIQTRLLWTLLISLAMFGCGSDDTSASKAQGGPAGQGGSAGSAGSAGNGASSGTGGSAGSSGSSGSAGVAGTSGGNCIAASYPGDVGIGNDPDVIFADDFESYTVADDLWSRWDNYFQASQTRIATEPANVYAGSQSLEFNLPQQTSELSNSVQKILTTELDELYLRYYSKFDTSFDVSGSSHNGGGISTHYFDGFNATPGIPADGYNKFLIEYECWRGDPSEPTPGALNVYIYYPEQRSNYGDHFFPTGLVQPNTSIVHDFGPTFVSRPDVVPELGRWYAYEVRLKANTVGMLDGDVTLWLDGQLIAEFPNVHFRDTDTLKIDRFNVSLHAGSNPNGPTKKWYDNVVAAKRCIGPMAPP